MRNNVKISNWRKHGKSRSRSFRFNAPSGNRYDTNGVGFNVSEMDMNSDGTWLHNALSVHLNQQGCEFDPKLSNFNFVLRDKEDFVCLDLTSNVKIYMSPEQFDQLQEVIGRHDPRQAD